MTRPGLPNVLGALILYAVLLVACGPVAESPEADLQPVAQTSQQEAPSPEATPFPTKPPTTPQLLPTKPPPESIPMTISPPDAHPDGLEGCKRIAIFSLEPD